MIDRALGRLICWAVRRAGRTNLLLLALLLLALGSTALGVADRVRGVDWALALTLAVLGLLVGWLVGLTPLSFGWASLVTGLLGLALVLLRVGRLGGELLAVLQACGRLLRAVQTWTVGGTAPALGPAWESLAALGEGAGALLARVAGWTTALFGGDSAFDPAAVSFVWGLGLWVAGAWAGWQTCRRQRPLWALTPSGVLLLTAFSYVWGSHVYLLSLLLAGFLIMALISYARRMDRWRATNVDYPELRPQTVAVTGFLSFALVTAAYVIPSLSIDRIVDLVSRAGEERSAETGGVAESFGMEARGRTAFQQVRTTGLPRRHLLDAGPELSEQVVVVVRTGDRPPGPAEEWREEPPRYYWRSHTYDRYTGVGWATSETEVMAYAAGVPATTGTLGSPGMPMVEQPSATQRLVRQEVRWVGERRDPALVAGTLMVADHDYTVAWRSSEDPFAATIEAKSYRADSVVPVASEDGLREDRGSYPNWVRERYLVLPEDVPSRVLALARDLTATSSTPYDRAQAIEAYLRGFPYSLDVSTPPSGRDVVDYFLFDLETGYCDYYASAMVVMARAAGLPARLAVGYASGSYHATEAQYVVTEADAHAWPEIYFPAHGWVRFEPTTGRPPLERAAEADSGWAEPEGALEPASKGWSGLQWTWWRVLLGVVVLLAMAGAIWRVLERRRLGRQEPAAVLARLYGRLRRFGRRLGVPMEAGDTPREFGAAFAGWIEAGGGDGSGDQPQRTGRWGALLTVGAGEVTWLTDLYGRASYSPRSPGAADRAEALRVWGRLQWRLWLTVVLRLLTSR